MVNIQVQNGTLMFFIFQMEIIGLVKIQTATLKCSKGFSPECEFICYGQVECKYRIGQFIKDLHEQVKDQENLVTSKIDRKEDIYKSIKKFLGKENKWPT